MTDPAAAYDGDATVTADGRTTSVTARLRGAFQPIDGRFHWYGRLSAAPELDRLGSGATVTLETEHAVASGRISDRDPWGRFRVAGVGRPPF